MDKGPQSPAGAGQRPFASAEGGIRKIRKRAARALPTIAVMEIYQLKTFAAVAAEGNLTRAAERVFTSPPAVSAQLKALEDELGVRLFDRTTRGMTLTAAGDRLLQEAQRTIAAARAMHAAAAALRGEARGIVRMGAVSDPLALRLGNVFVRLAERHPHVTVQLQQTLSIRALDAVRRGELDCAYVLNEHAQLDGLDVRRLAPSEVVVVLPPQFGRLDTPASLQDLVRLPWVSTPADCGLRALLERLFASVGRSVPAGPMADTEGAVRGMVAGGLGAGLMRRDQAEEAERAGEVVVWQQWRAETWLCWVGAKTESEAPCVAAVRDAVLEAWA
jgi:DNA-binding transcriptional LysR family regulator